jgi:hypothetical protein
MDESRRRLAAEMSGLGIHYDLGEGHPLLGRRMPDLDLVTANGPLRVFTLLHDARPALPTSVGQAASTSLHGRIAFSRSTPNTWVRGSFPRSGRSRLPPPFWFGPTDMWPGWET